MAGQADRGGWRLDYPARLTLARRREARVAKVPGMPASRYQQLDTTTGLYQCAAACKGNLPHNSHRSTRSPGMRRIKSIGVLVIPRCSRVADPS